MDLRHKAIERVERKRRFYAHFGIYVLMSVFFFLINVFSSDYLWFHWPVLGWGIGIVVEYLKVFGLPGKGADWEARELEREVRRLEGHHAPAEDELDLPQAEKQPQKNWDDKELV